MDQVRFGSLLREARERKGLDLSAVSSRLRIRSDILRAIEDSDLAHMPPKGYARNMVNSYARFLGLNSTEITSMYLDEVYAYQVSQARMGARAKEAFNFQQGHTRQHAASANQRNSNSSESGRELYFDDRRGNRRRGESSSATRSYPENRTHRSSRSVVPSAQYTNFYSGPHASQVSGGSKLPFIIAAVIILILLLIIVVLLVRGGISSGTEDVANIPVSGLTDPINDDSTSTSDDTDDTTDTSSAAPTSATFTLSLEDGAEAWVQLYIDDSTELAQVLTGPYEQSYEVTGTLRLVTPRPGSVTCTLDGEELEFTLVSGSSVNYEVTVDFAEILAAWEEENGLSSSDSTDGDATTNL